MTPLVQVSMVSLMAGSPQASTNATSSRYGLQATKISPAVCFMATVLTGLSPSSRMMVFGFHSFSTATITMMQVSELRMSVSSGPIVVRDEELHAGKRHAAGDDGRQHFTRAGPSGHDHDRDSRG